MTGRRFPLACLLFYCLFQACSQKVCPAFESFYLLDENTREKQFSYFVDSLPRTDIAKVHKNRYGIGDEPFLASLVNKIPPPIHSPWAKINTIEPVVIYPELPDSLEFAGDELMAAEMDIPDSSAFEADTTEVAKNWHFNIDQENYFNYLIKRLNIPIVPVEDAESAVEEQETTATETDSTGAPQKKGFLRNLFKKKNKEETQELVPSDSTQNQNGNNR